MIKAIVFDFGNVLYKLDECLFHRNLSAIIKTKVSEGSYPLPLIDVFRKYEIGQISTESFIWEIQHQIDPNLNPRSIINSWNSILKAIDSSIWPFLSELRSSYKLFILSNINELHLDAVYRHIRNIHGEIDFESNYFDAVFYSHMIHMRKPSNEIYRFVGEMIHFSPKEILFIDDKQENVEGALRNGWNSVLHDPETDIVQKLPEYLSNFH